MLPGAVLGVFLFAGVFLSQKTSDEVFRPHSGRPSGGIHPVGPGAHSAWPSARFAGNSASGIRDNAVAAAGVGVGYGAVLHQHQLVVAGAAHVGAENAVVAVFQFGLHGAAGNFCGEHVMVGLYAGRAFYPALRLNGHAAAEIAAGGFQAEHRQIIHVLQGGGHVGLDIENFL